MDDPLINLIIDYADGWEKNSQFTNGVNALHHEYMHYFHLPVKRNNRRPDEEEAARALKRAIFAGEVAGKMQASRAYDEEYPHFQDLVSPEKVVEPITNYREMGDDGKYHGIPLRGEALKTAGAVLADYLRPIVEMIWDYAYMKGRMDEAAEQWPPVPF